MKEIDGVFTPDTMNYIWDLAVTYGLAIVVAVIVLIVGLMIIKWIVNTAGRIMEKRSVDASLRPFLRTMIGTLLRIMLIISVIGMVGIETTSFIAVLGAAGLAVGMALSGTLQNFAGGVIILILKPFKVGHFIDGGGHAGTVREIQIFYTYLTTPTGQEIIVPNSALSNNSIINYSFNPSRRLDMTFRVAYGDDIDQAKATLQKIGDEESRFLSDKGINIFVEELSDSAVNIRLRAWANSSDYWDIFNNLSEKVKKEFDSAGLRMPYPQTEVYLHPEKKAS